MNTPIWYGNIGVMPTGSARRRRRLQARMSALGLTISAAMDRLIGWTDRLKGCGDRCTETFGCPRMAVLVPIEARCPR